MANGNVNIGVNVQTNGQAGLNQLNQALKNINSSATQLNTASAVADGFASALGRIGAITGGLYAVKEALSSLIETANGLDKVKAKLNFANGNDAQKTAQDLAYIRAEAVRLGIDLQTSAEGFAKLKIVATQQGWNTKEQQDFFSGFSEFARVMGADKGQIDGAMLAFTQMLSKGRVAAEELNGQLADRFPAAVPLFAKALGVSSQGLQELMRKGELSTEVLKHVGYIMHQEVAPQLSTAEATMSASIARLGTAFYEFKNRLADGSFKKAITDVSTTITSALNAKLFDPLAKGWLDSQKSMLESLVEWGVKMVMGVNTIALKMAEVLTSTLDKLAINSATASSEALGRKIAIAEQLLKDMQEAGDTRAVALQQTRIGELTAEKKDIDLKINKAGEDAKIKAIGFEAMKKELEQNIADYFKNQQAKQGVAKDIKAPTGKVELKNKDEADKIGSAMRAYGKAMEEANTQRLKAMHDAEKALLDQHYAERLIGEKEYQGKLSDLQLEAYNDELGNLQNHRQQITTQLSKEKDPAKQLALQGDIAKVDAKIFEVEKKVESEPIRLKTKLVGIEESLAQARAQIEAELLTIKGFQGAGATAQLDEKQRQFNRQNVGNPEQIALYGELINLQKQKVQLDEQERAFSEANQFYKLREQELNAQATLGLTTQREANRTLREEREAMIPVLEETIRKYEEMARSMPDNAELKLKVQGMKVSLLDLKGQADELDTAMNNAFANGIVKGIDDVINKTKSLGDVLKNILQSLVSSFAQIMAKRFIDSAVGGGGLFSGLSKLIPGFADGGYVAGPGTGRSDSIPAWLSNGEFVMNAQATRYWGSDFLHSLNAPKFADGGLVGAGGAGGAGGLGGTTISITNAISNEDIANSMNSRPGEQAILNVIQRNAGTIKQVVR